MGPWEHACREGTVRFDIGGGTHVVKGRWVGGNADHQIRTLPMEGRGGAWEQKFRCEPKGHSFIPGGKSGAGR